MSPCRLLRTTPLLALLAASGCQAPRLAGPQPPPPEHFNYFVSHMMLGVQRSEHDVLRHDVQLGPNGSTLWITYKNATLPVVSGPTELGGTIVIAARPHWLKAVIYLEGTANGPKPAGYIDLKVDGRPLSQAQPNMQGKFRLCAETTFTTHEPELRWKMTLAPTEQAKITLDMITVSVGIERGTLPSCPKPEAAGKEAPKSRTRPNR